MVYLIAIITVLLAGISDVDNDQPEYITYKTSKVITVDGQIDEQPWEEAAEGTFINADGSAPRQKTIFKWIWDDKYLYGAFFVEDDHIWAKMTERDAYLWHENVVEFFINADGSSKSYVEIEINPLNTILDLFVLNKHNNRSDIRQLWNWDCEGLLSAVQVEGTINDASDKDDHWTFEIAIPFDQIYTAPNHPPIDGDTWFVTFTRGEGRENPDRPEASSWSPPAFHNPLSYGKMIFKKNR
jgi:hypothetical protein